jgi:hypothetical protein
MYRMGLLVNKAKPLSLGSLSGQTQRFESRVQMHKRERLTSSRPVAQRSVVLADGASQTLGLGICIHVPYQRKQEIRLKRAPRRQEFCTEVNLRLPVASAGSSRTTFKGDSGHWQVNERVDRERDKWRQAGGQVRCSPYGVIQVGPRAVNLENEFLREPLRQPNLLEPGHEEDGREASVRLQLVQLQTFAWSQPRPAPRHQDDDVRVVCRVLLSLGLLRR